MKLPILILIATFLQWGGVAFGSDSRLEPEMIQISKGSYLMGNNKYASTSPAHLVSFGYSFEIGKTEITQAQWLAEMGVNPSYFGKCGGDCPVENVSFDDAVRYIKHLNMSTGKIYRLPSEAEWEYACRADSNDEYCGGSSAEKVAWHDSNSGGKTNGVALKTPNVFGVYDMSGNVWEWTQDCLHVNYIGAPADGAAWESGDCSRHILRGGSWYSGLVSLRSTDRGGYDFTGDRSNLIGLRIARTLP